LVIRWGGSINAIGAPSEQVKLCNKARDAGWNPVDSKFENCINLPNGQHVSASTFGESPRETGPDCRQSRETPRIERSKTNKKDTTGGTT
jgi:hypothetical protein